MKQEDQKHPQAFTVKYHSLVNELRTEIFVSPFASEQEEKPPSKEKSYMAIWDTGATNSVISKKIVEDFSLSSIDVVMVHHAGGYSKCNTYMVTFKLPGKIGKFPLNVTEGEFFDDHGYDRLIGMDVISKGDFCITSKGEKTVFSFRYPSYDHIDFLYQTF